MENLFYPIISIVLILIRFILVLAFIFLIIRFLPKQERKAYVRPEWYLLIFLLEAGVLALLKINLFTDIYTITKSFFIINIFVFPIIMSLGTFGWAKGLFYGSILSIAIISFDLLFIKDVFDIFENFYHISCSDFCGIEDIFAIYATGICAGIGIVIGLISKAKNRINALKTEENAKTIV